MSSKLERLLVRELDGELTDVERAELERGAYTAPDLRHERAGWSAVTSAMRERSAPRVNALKMASAVVRELPERHRRARPRRLLFAAAAALAFAALSQVGPAKDRRPARAPIAEASHAAQMAPVVIHVDHASFVEDAEPVPVEIQF
jgi:anti-sigma factor RsiW